MNRRKAILLALMGSVLATVVLWRGSTYVESRTAALAAEKDLAACQELAAKIERFNQHPPVATEQEQLADQTNALIESAAKSVGIDAKSLIRITPEPPRRLDDTAYKEKPTHVLLRKVTLEQLVGFIHKMLGVQQGFNAKSIRLSAPEPQDTGPLWTAEITLTYLIYDP
ncbi:MAG: hypothetical protein HQ546_01175 [Planctomycetes bacterium]|nr:hypothetical protein [Planctomycetota bacterium]